MDIEVLLAAFGVSVGTTAAIIAGLRFAGPLFGKIFGAALKTRAQLDQDRDRIITNLRDEIGDLTRRLDEEEEQNKRLLTQAKECKDEVENLNTFIDTLLTRLGTTRKKVENGEPLPLQRRAG